MNRGFFFTQTIFSFLYLPEKFFQSENVTGKNTRFFYLYRKVITIEIIDRDQYQRNETFLIRLDEPSLITDQTEAEKLGM